MGTDILSLPVRFSFRMPGLFKPCVILVPTMYQKGSFTNETYLFGTWFAHGLRNVRTSFIEGDSSFIVF